MDRKYKAFISYRHLPLEMSIAKKLHQRIEHYTIPRELRKNGVKKPGYVFRDQDELPISSDLSANIRLALDRSEYLIVICTPETGKSAWVLEEIRYFLATHDRDHILVLLADGTSDEAFPDLLTSVYSDKGEFIERVEPLAANIVASSEAKRNRLFATESLRIIAALIGCTYDELYKREQRYKRRRIAAAAAVVAAVAAVFIAVLINRNREIRANYDRALRNQSQYLASESLKLLEEGDRLSAIALAMEALPSETNERPLVSRAEYALGCAVRAYTAPWSAAGLQASGMLTHGGTVSSFCLNESRTLLCSQLNEGTLVGWDTQSMQKLWSLSPGEDDLTAGIAGFWDDDTIIVWANSELRSLEASSGEERWTVSAAAFARDEWEKIACVCLAEESRDVVAVTPSVIVLIDGETGTVRKTFYWPETDEDGKKLSFYFTRPQVSPSGERLAAVYYSESNFSRCGMAVMDLRSGEVRLCDLFIGDYYFPKAVLFPDEDIFIYCSSDLSGGSASSVYDTQIMVRSTRVLHCVDLKTGDTLWETTHVSSSAASNDIFLYDTSLTDRPIVIYAYANHLDVLDAASGEKIAETEFGSRIIRAQVCSSFILCTLDNGETGLVYPTDWHIWYSQKTFVEDLKQAAGRPGEFWVLPLRSSGIVHFSPVTSDPAWMPIDTVMTGREDGRGFYEDSFLVDGKCIALMDGERLLVSDGDPAHPLREADLPTGGDNGRFSYLPVSYEDGTLRIRWSDRSDTGAVLVDTDTLETRVVSFEDDELRLLALYGDTKGTGWLALAVLAADEDDDSAQTLSVLRLNDELKIEKRLEIGQFSALQNCSAVCDPAGRLWLVLPEEGKCFCIDLDKMQTTENGAELGSLLISLRESGKDLSGGCFFGRSGSLLAVKGRDNNLEIFSENGDRRYTITGESGEILSAAFMPDGKELLTVGTDGMLRRYRASDGHLESKAELYYSVVLRSDTVILWSFTDSGFLTVRVDDFLNLVSTDDWETFAYVPYCYGYAEEHDFLFCKDYSGGERCFGGFPRHSLESLIEYGESVLNGWSLSETQRMTYGLD